MILTMMRAIILFCVLVSFFVGVSSRPRQGTIQNLKSPQITQSSSNEGPKNIIGSAKNKETNKIGSSPPNCEHKCYGCSPCDAIQVPTHTGRVGVQYTNYEPEGWKCKCGPTLYSP